MAISFPRSFLTHKKPSRITIRPSKADGVATSPFDFTQQVYEFVGERWLADITFPPMARPDAEKWIAWLVSLRGHHGSFTMGDPNGTAPRGTASGSVTVTGSVRARTVTVSGSGTLLAGDWISIGNRYLHKVTADASLTGSVEIWPALRTTVSGASASTSNAVGQWMLAELPEWTIDRGGSVYQIGTVKAVEDMR